MKSKFIIGMIAVASLTSGCATLISGTTQSINIDTGKVAGADCVGIDKKGHQFNWLNTPSSATVQKGDGPMIITCKKEGYENATVSTDETFVKASLGNIILGGGIGFLVDAASGAAQEYPVDVKVPMRPVEVKEVIASKDVHPPLKTQEQQLAELNSK